MVEERVKIIFMLNPNFVFVGIVINAIGLSSYFLDTIKGKIKPNKVSFALWSLAPLIAFLAEFKQGVGIQSLMVLSTGLFPIIILIGTFLNKKAYWKITKFDLYCGAFSLVGLLLWQVTKVGNIAIFFSILADGLAYVPTIRKAYTNPETESAWPWFAVALNGLFTLLTIKSWNFANSAFPLYFLLANLVVFIVVQFKLGKRKKNFRFTTPLS